MSYIAWDETDIQSLRQMWTNNLSCSQISKALNDKFTRSAVAGKARRLGLEDRDPSMNRHLQHAQPKLLRDLVPPPQKKVKEVKPKELGPEPEVIGLPGEFPLRGCLWPSWGDLVPDFRFCGQPRHKGSFCEHHAAISYVKPKARQ